MNVFRHILFSLLILVCPWWWCLGLSSGLVLRLEDFCSTSVRVLVLGDPHLRTEEIERPTISGILNEFDTFRVSYQWMSLYSVYTELVLIKEDYCQFLLLEFIIFNTLEVVHLLTQTKMVCIVNNRMVPPFICYITTVKKKFYYKRSRVYISLISM